MTRFRIAFLGLALTTVVTTLLLAGPVFGSRHSSAEAEARSVTAEFFRSINDRRYERTCALLSRAYYRRYRISSGRRCAIGLRIGFLWSQEIRFRITGVTVDADRVIVRALADRVPGRLVMIRERGLLKVLVVDGR
jgi:hypothetical protein